LGVKKEFCREVDDAVYQGFFDEGAAYVSFA
jgi:hypothetical protein